MDPFFTTNELLKLDARPMTGSTMKYTSTSGTVLEQTRPFTAKTLIDIYSSEGVPGDFQRQTPLPPLNDIEREDTIVILNAKISPTLQCSTHDISPLILSFVLHKIEHFLLERRIRHAKFSLKDLLSLITRSPLCAERINLNELFYDLERRTVSLTRDTAATFIQSAWRRKICQRNFRSCIKIKRAAIIVARFLKRCVKSRAQEWSRRVLVLSDIELAKSNKEKVAKSWKEKRLACSIIVISSDYLSSVGCLSYLRESEVSLIYVTRVLTISERLILMSNLAIHYTKDEKRFLSIELLRPEYCSSEVSLNTLLYLSQSSIQKIERFVKGRACFFEPQVPVPHDVHFKYPLTESLDWICKLRNKRHVQRVILKRYCSVLAGTFIDPSREANLYEELEGLHEKYPHISQYTLKINGQTRTMVEDHSKHSALLLKLRGGVIEEYFSGCFILAMHLRVFPDLTVEVIGSHQQIAGESLKHIGITIPCQHPLSTLATKESLRLVSKLSILGFFGRLTCKFLVKNDELKLLSLKPGITPELGIVMHMKYVINDKPDSRLFYNPTTPVEPSPQKLKYFALTSGDSCEARVGVYLKELICTALAFLSDDTFHSLCCAADTTISVARLSPEKFSLQLVLDSNAAIVQQVKRFLQKLLNSVGGGQNNFKSVLSYLSSFLLGARELEEDLQFEMIQTQSFSTAQCSDETYRLLNSELHSDILADDKDYGKVIPLMPKIVTLILHEVERSSLRTYRFHKKY